MLPARFDPAAADDHVDVVERSIQTVKADCRTLTHGLPFKRVPRLMAVEMVLHAIKCRNMLPANDGISSTLSPLSIVTGAGKVDYNHHRLEFGTYVHIFNDHHITNTIAPHTTGAIALNSVGNSKGDYYFLNLETGRRVSRHQWTVLPMPHSMIQQVHLLGLKDKMPMLNRRSLVFERRPGTPLPDTELEQEGINLLEYGDDGDDEDFIPADDETDVPLVHDNNISINEIMDIQGPLPDDHFVIDSDSDSDSDESSYDTDSDTESDDESSQNGDDIHDENHLSEINFQSNDNDTKDPRSS